MGSSSKCLLQTCPTFVGLLPNIRSTPATGHISAFSYTHAITVSSLPDQQFSVFSTRHTPLCLKSLPLLAHLSWTQTNYAVDHFSGRNSLRKPELAWFVGKVKSWKTKFQGLPSVYRINTFPFQRAEQPYFCVCHGLSLLSSLKASSVSQDDFCSFFRLNARVSPTPMCWQQHTTLNYPFSIWSCTGFLIVSCPPDGNI